MSSKLPEPACTLGFTAAQLEEFFGARTHDFNHFMQGQTIALCAGRKYDYDTKVYVQTEHLPHGVVYYARDVYQFILGGPPLD